MPCKKILSLLLLFSIKNFFKFQEKPRKNTDIKSVIASLLGTVIEYYDYTLYGFCAALLARHFFADDDPTVALIKTFGTFMIGSLAKPMGALLFGWIGDRYGRRPSLRISLIGIIIPTTIVALLPGYDQWGWGASVILLGCRLAQGLFVSGEADGVHIYILESLPPKRACFGNSLVLLAMFIGINLASWAAALISQPGYPTWIWRLPFLGGSLLGVGVIWWRHYIKETPAFIAYEKSQDPSFISKTSRSIFIQNWRPILVTILLCGGVGGGYHFYFVFLGTYLSSTLQILDPAITSFYTAVSLGVYTLFLPIFGLAADRWGILPVLRLSMLTSLVFGTLNVLALAKGSLPLPLMLLTAVSLSCFHSPGYVLLASQFNVGERYRCLSLGHALGSMLFSGNTPLICLSLWQTTHISALPFFYLILVTGLGGIALRARKHPLPRADFSYFPSKESAVQAS